MGCGPSTKKIELSSGASSAAVFNPTDVKPNANAPAAGQPGQPQFDAANSNKTIVANKKTI